ncbi:MAG: matrixin family metalloprotease [Dehalococcoidia bacterium]
MTWRLPLALILSLMLLGALRAAPSGVADSTVRDVDLMMALPDGSRVMLMFAVDAPTEEAALETALATAHDLMPGATVVSDDGAGVSAQFAAWWWQWDATEVPVPVFYNPGGNVNAVTEADIAAALAAWAGVEGSSFAFAYMGLTDASGHVQDGVNDGYNVVAWQPLDCSTGCVLGITTKTEAHETDVILNSNPEARLGDGSGGSIDTRTVLVHEAGHMAGLEHSCPLFGCTEAEQDAVMYFQYRGEKRTLHPDDIAGIQALYPGTPPLAGERLQTLAIALPEGWSLTVLPPGAMDTTMERLACVDAVYHWDGTAWRTWLRGAHPLLQDIVNADQSTAYWTHTNAACSYLFVVSA